MRTTITIHDDLLAEAKARAATSGRMLDAIGDEALRRASTRRAGAPRSAPFPLPMLSASRLVSGADPDDGAALLDLAEPAGS